MGLGLIQDRPNGTIITIVFQDRSTFAKFSGDMVFKSAEAYLPTIPLRSQGSLEIRF